MARGPIRSGGELNRRLNAVLRDYARLGLLLAHEGNWRGRQIVPAAWVTEATTTRADQPHLRPGVATPFAGYGYQTRILPGERRMFLLGHSRPADLRPSSEQAGDGREGTAVHKRPIDVAMLRGSERPLDGGWPAASSATDRGQARATATVTRASSEPTSRVSQPVGRGAAAQLHRGSVSAQM